MSKQQSKQTFNAGNTQESTVQQQGAANNTQLQGAYAGSSGNASSLFPGINAGYGAVASSGGYDPGQLNQIQSAYGDLSTGGISPTQIGAMEQQASRSAQSAYSTGTDQLHRQIASTGGNGFTGAADASMARGSSQAAADATNQSLAGIVAQQSANKATGAAGLSSVQQNLTGNKLAGLQGQQGLYNTNVAASQQQLQQILQNFQMTGQLSNQDLQILAGIGSEAGAGMNTINGIGTIGGAAAGVLGGLGKIGVGQSAGG